MRRGRRLRISKNLRDSLAEIKLEMNQFVHPLFIVEGTEINREIKSMPGVFHMSVDVVVKEMSKYLDFGLTNFILFGVPSHKTFDGAGAFDPEGPVPKALRAIKDEWEEPVLYSDVCLCEYTDHGHCGIPDSKGYIINDISLKQLAKTALAYAEAGSDWVAPSNMMDFRVRSIREVLDDNGFNNTSILSYSAKFASAYYGPFRDVANSAPSYGDRNRYQLDYRGSRQAMFELESDEEQGADAVMVKPALAYLDILSKAREETNLPLYAYNVSGEYSMVKLGVKSGLFDEKKIVLENLTAIKRAGADMIITYHGTDIARNEWL